jgi:hypothetical protein
VVDLWGGRRTPTGQAPWNEDTMVPVNSTTKSLAAWEPGTRRGYYAMTIGLYRQTSGGDP